MAFILAKSCANASYVASVSPVRRYTSNVQGAARFDTFALAIKAARSNEYPKLIEAIEVH